MSRVAILFVMTSVTLIGACGQIPEDGIEGVSQAIQLDSELKSAQAGSDGRRGCPLPPFPCIQPVVYGFEDHAPARLKRVNVCAGKFVDAIQLVWEDPNEPRRSIFGPVHGGSGGNCEFPGPLELADDEFIVDIRGRSGSYIDQLTLVTNKRAKTWGGTGGRPFDIFFADGDQVHGLYGRISHTPEGAFVTSIGGFSYFP